MDKEFKIFLIGILLFLILSFYIFYGAQKEQEDRCKVIGQEQSGEMRRIWQCPNGIEIF